MTELTPEQLVENIATDFVSNYNNMFPERSRGEFKDLPQEQKEGLLKQGESALRVFLKSIADGQVVEYTEFKPEGRRTILKPQYAEFLAKLI